MKAIYPGTFNPITNGHLDLIERAAKLYGELVIAVVTSSSKQPGLTVDERVRLVERCCESLTNVVVQPFTGLLVDFARAQGAAVLLRGLRAVSDFDYEFQMAGMNRQLAPELETVFLPASERHAFVSSTMVRGSDTFGW